MKKGVQVFLNCEYAKKVLTLFNKKYRIELRSCIYAIKLKKGGMVVININKFKAKIVEAGFNMTSFAEEIGMDYSTLYRKINNISVFTISDVETITKKLKLNEKEILEIFFGKIIA